jgi:serine/threonine protein kinase
LIIAQDRSTTSDVGTAYSGVPVSALTPGMQLGKYRLVKQLAIGGMAEVYLARATGIEGFEKLVVLKRILPQYAARRDFVAMFLDEARLAARLHHPNIVQVFDIGAQIGNYYFAMEYVRGEDVRAILSRAARQRTRVPLGCAISIVLDVCRGLHYAHERKDDAGQPLQVVHRDVSPSNVIVTYDGCTKLLDFGVAKARSHSRETQAGTLKGKIAYMSPEQCRGEELDRRSDVFAIGILLFELTTGTRLYKGRSELEILTKIATHDAPSPAARRPDYPDELARIVGRALTRDRDQRYRTALELERDLEAYARDARLSTSPIDLGEFVCGLFPQRAAASDVVAPAPIARGKRKQRDEEPSILIVDSFDSGVGDALDLELSDVAPEPARRPQLRIVTALPDDPRELPPPPTQLVPDPELPFEASAALARGARAGSALPRSPAVPAAAAPRSRGRLWALVGVLAGLSAGALVVGDLPDLDILLPTRSAADLGAAASQPGAPTPHASHTPHRAAAVAPAAEQSVAAAGAASETGNRSGAESAPGTSRLAAPRREDATETSPAEASPAEPNAAEAGAAEESPAEANAAEVRAAEADRVLDDAEQPVPRPAKRSRRKRTTSVHEVVVSQPPGPDADDAPAEPTQRWDPDSALLPGM